MKALLPTVDFTDIRKVKDLPISWMSTQGRDIGPAGAYERQCKAEGKTPDQKTVAELIGGDIVHLRKTVLGNGLKLVSIHKADESEIFSDHEYGGIHSCNCGAIHDSPGVQMASAISGVDLGDGFKLLMVVSGHSERKGRGHTSTYAEKEFEVQGKKVKAHYSVEPPYGEEAGHLIFTYEVRTPGVFAYEVQNMSEGGRVEQCTEPYMQKYVKVAIRTEVTNKTDGKNHPYCTSSLLIAHNLPEHYGDIFQGAFDQIEFEFGVGGLFERVVGISQKATPNPEWTDPEMLRALGKGMDSWFDYPLADSQGLLLAKAIFGKEHLVELIHDTRASLTELMEAAIQEKDIDPVKAMHFFPN